MKSTLKILRHLNTLKSPKYFFLSRQYNTQTKKPIVTVFGGTGFLGSHVVRKLAPHCSSVRVACRDPDPVNKIYEQENLPNVRAEFANIVDQNSVGHSMEGADAVVNMASIKYESEYSFWQLFVHGPGHVSYNARKYGVKTVVQMSCLGAELEGECKFLDWVYRSEDISYGNFPDVTILRAGLMYGKGNVWVNKILKQGRFSPVVFCPSAKKKVQPVWVEDVADSIVECVLNDSTRGKVYELGGPQVYTWKEFYEALFKAAGYSKKIIIPMHLSAFNFLVCTRSLLPKPSLSREHVYALAKDLIVTQEKNELTFKDLNITPKQLEEAFQLEKAAQQ